MVAAKRTIVIPRVTVVTVPSWSSLRYRPNRGRAHEITNLEELDPI